MVFEQSIDPIVTSRNTQHPKPNYESVSNVVTQQCQIIQEVR